MTDQMTGHETAGHEIIEIAEHETTGHKRARYHMKLAQMRQTFEAE